MARFKYFFMVALLSTAHATVAPNWTSLLVSRLDDVVTTPRTSKFLRGEWDSACPLRLNLIFGANTASSLTVKNAPVKSSSQDGTYSYLSFEVPAAAFQYIRAKDLLLPATGTSYTYDTGDVLRINFQTFYAVVENGPSVPKASINYAIYRGGSVFAFMNAKLSKTNTTQFIYDFQSSCSLRTR